MAKINWLDCMIKHKEHLYESYVHIGNAKGEIEFTESEPLLRHAMYHIDEAINIAEKNITKYQKERESNTDGRAEG